MADHGLDTPPDNELIDVMPTKAFFVDMLTKDIGLTRAIIDLVDNCIDGARRLRDGGNAGFTGLHVSLTANQTAFEISDNCGGIGIDTAKRYAFRMGRPTGTPSTPGSVGQFGVGMKRALFKLGRKFRVTSTTTVDRFVLEVDVDDWLSKEPWNFRFASIETGLELPVEHTGTTIRVWELRQPVAQSFSSDFTLNALHAEIQATQQTYIDLGLRITLNDRPMHPSNVRLLYSAELSPAHTEQILDEASSAPIRVLIYAGVGESSPREAGWYVFCNGRLVLGSDQSKATGWDRTIETIKAPKFHNQFARFRGYVYFECQDASKLPWNTTKTGVDEDSALYKATLELMVASMRPVIDFLNDLDAEQDRETNDRPLTQVLQRAASRPIRDIPVRNAFSYALPAAPGPQLTTISFKRTTEKIDELKEALGARSAREVGERSFDMAHKSLVEQNQ